MATLPFYAQRKLARKTSDITRLTEQYKANVNDLSSQFESSFSEYQKKRDAIMAPYTAAVDKYKGEYSAYEANLGQYKTALSEYQKKLQDAVDNPLGEVPTDQYSTTNLIRQGTIVRLGDKRYTIDELPDGYTYENGKLYKAKDPGKFEQKAPTAPEAPTAPTVEEFDSTQFDSKRAALDTNLKRELGERRAAKASAVSRKSARPLLQGA
jgi:hypothetical protein